MPCDQRVTARRATTAPAVLAGAVTAALLITHTAGPVDAAAKAKHDLLVTGEEIGGEGTNKFRIYGTVATFKGRNITVQVKVNNGDWDLWKRTATAAEDGAFSERIYGGKRGSKVCYKVVVPSTERYRTTKKRAACITTDPR
jgi:hypothetical protein